MQNRQTPTVSNTVSYVSGVVFGIAVLFPLLLSSPRGGARTESASCRQEQHMLVAYTVVVVVSLQRQDDWFFFSFLGQWRKTTTTTGPFRVVWKRRNRYGWLCCCDKWVSARSKPHPGLTCRFSGPSSTKNKRLKHFQKVCPCGTWKPPVPSWHWRTVTDQPDAVRILLHAANNRLRVPLQVAP